MKKFWGYSQIHAVIRKVWLNFTLVYFLTFQAFSAHIFALWSAAVIGTYWCHERASDKKKKSAFKDSSYLQEKIQKYSLYKCESAPWQTSGSCHMQASPFHTLDMSIICKGVVNKILAGFIQWSLKRGRLSLLEPHAQRRMRRSCET